MQDKAKEDGEQEDLMVRAAMRKLKGRDDEGQKQIGHGAGSESRDEGARETGLKKVER